MKPSRKHAVGIAFTVTFAGVVSQTLAGCASESDVQAAQASLERSSPTRLRGEGVRTVSASELDRLLSSEVLPAPIAIAPSVAGTDDREAARRMYRDELDALGGRRVVARVDGKEETDAGSLVRLTTLAGTGPRFFTVLVQESCELPRAVFAVGATLLVHVRGDEQPSGIPGAARLHHALLGGGLQPMLAVEVLAPGLYRVFFPWGPDDISTTDLRSVP